MLKNTESASPPSSAKRKKVEDDVLNSLTSKKQRTRVSFSCGECHRRKQKCDRQMPCSHCVARKVPDLCKAYTPGKVDQDLSVRVSRLEHIIELALPQLCSPGTPTLYSNDTNTIVGRRRSSSNGEDDNRSQTEEPVEGVFQSGKWYGNGASGSVAPASLIEQFEHVAIPNCVVHDKDFTQSPHIEDLNTNLHPSSSNKPKSNMVTVGDDSESSAADNMKSLIQECGVSPHKISELLQELPPQRLSDVLIDYYFTSINWTRYPVSEEDFRSAYLSVCNNGRNGIGATNPNDVRFLPLLFVVLAISVRLAPENLAGDARTRRITSLRYYWSSRRSLLIAAAIQPDSLDIVFTRLLSARFLTFDRRITECWSQLGAAVRTAQALGLHRDGGTMSGMSAATVEYRRRIWSYLYHADRSYALVLGRPNSIQDDYTSTKPPSNIDGELSFSSTHSIEVLPLSHPTPMTFVILRHQLAEIIGGMVHHFQQVRTKSHYSEVVALDDELLRFINTLPSHFSLQCDTTLDRSLTYIPVHRFLLITEILFVRISLHRPYLLKRLNSDRYARSRNACFESAIKDFEVRQAFRETMPKETRDSLSNAYREFQTAMISGIYFVLEPNGAYATAMHAILDGFVNDHEGTRDLDVTTRRELKTIEFLKSKASQVEKLGDQPRRPSQIWEHTANSRPEQQAQLLLSLQKPLTTPLSSCAKSYPSLTSLNTEGASPLQSILSASNSVPIAHSPTMQRLQHTAIADYAQSPTTSGSPYADDESPAQSLLDNWCHAVSNASVDTTTDSLSPGGPIGTEISGWAGITYSAAGTDARHSLLSGLDGSDYSYWEALVNQIHRGS